MKKFAVAAVAAALLPLSAPVMAKDICLQADWGSYFKFKNVKSLKPNKITPLVGAYLEGGQTVPVSGSAIVRADGTVRYGVHVYSIMYSNSFTLHISAADATMAGTGGWDNDGNMTQNGAATMTAVDCKTLPEM